MTVNRPEGKAGIFGPHRTAGIPDHPFRDIRQTNGNIGRKKRPVLRPERTVSAAQLQYFHAGMNLALLKKPGKPSLRILGIKTVQPDAGRYVCCIFVLAGKVQEQ